MSHSERALCLRRERAKACQKANLIYRNGGGQIRHRFHSPNTMDLNLVVKPRHVSFWRQIKETIRKYAQRLFGWGKR